MRGALLALLLASCAQVPTPPPTTVGVGRTACLVRGLGGPLTSYLTAGRASLESMGYRVEVHDMGVDPEELDHCDTVIAHSWGAPPALKARGPRHVFVIDGFALAGLRCPDGAECVSYVNVTNTTGSTLPGARVVDCERECGFLDGVPFLVGHMAMASSPWIWADMERSLEHE